MVRQEPKINRGKTKKGAKIELSQGQKEYLGRSRRRSHNKADEDTATPSRIIDHPLVCANQTELVSDQAALDRLIKKLRKTGSFAFDTEFIGEQTYYPHLCLIQVATEELVAVIDPLAEIDLSGFWKLLTDKKVCKIVHAGGQDLEPAWRLTGGKEPANVFDTQIAAGFAAMPYPLNLRELVYRLTGAKLKKASGFTQWNRRPLSTAQLSYAADDVRYLPAVMAALKAVLAQNGNLKWSDAQNAAACKGENWQFDPVAAALKMRGAKDLTVSQLAVLAEVLNWRELLAQHSNIPARMALADDSVRKLARKYKHITSTDDMAELASVPQRVIAAAGSELLEAINLGKTRDTSGLERPRPSSESAVRRHLTDSMWIMLQVWCVSKQVHPSLVTSRQELAEFFAARCPRKDREIDIQLLGESPLNQGWRKDLLQELLGKLTGDKSSITLKWANGIEAVN